MSNLANRQIQYRQDCCTRVSKVSTLRVCGSLDMNANRALKRKEKYKCVSTYVGFVASELNWCWTSGVGVSMGAWSSWGEEVELTQGGVSIYVVNMLESQFLHPPLKNTPKNHSTSPRGR